MGFKRFALYLSGLFVGVTIAVTVIGNLIEEFGGEISATRQGVAQYYLDQLIEFEARDASRGQYRAIFLGDSMSISYPAGHEVPLRLERRLKRIRDRAEDPEFSIVPFGITGSGVFDYYCLADLVVEAKPDLVIIEFNFANFSESWRDAFSRAELSGWIGADRYAE